MPDRSHLLSVDNKRSLRILHLPLSRTRRRAPRVYPSSHSVAAIQRSGRGSGLSGGVGSWVMSSASAPGLLARGSIERSYFALPGRKKCLPFEIQPLTF